MVGRPLRRFATAGSGMVAGRTDGSGLRKRPRSSSRKQPREAAKIQMKRGGRLSERASASRDWNEWLFWEFDGTVVSLSHCVLCGRSEDVAYFPSSAHVKHGPFVAGERPSDRGGQRRFRRRQRHSCSFIRSGKFVSPKVLVPAR